MPILSETIVSAYDDTYAWLKKELNFFRIHLLFFLLVPLISAAVFWGANGRFHISFIDALFLCYSALTVTGLSTVNLSTCTVFQQAILFFLMCIGNVTVVAWVMVLIRKHYFRMHLENLKRNENSKRKIAHRIIGFLHFPGRNRPANARSLARSQEEGAKDGKICVQEGIGAALVGGGSAGIGMGVSLGRVMSKESTNIMDGQTQTGETGMTVTVEQPSRQPTYDIHVTSSPQGSARNSFAGTERSMVLQDQAFASDSPKSADLALPPSPVLSPQMMNTPGTQFTMQSPYSGVSSARRRGPVPQRRMTVFQPPPQSPNPSQLGQRGKDQGHGGFPGPLQLFHKFIRRFLPMFHKRLGEILSIRKKEEAKLEKEYGRLVIGRNSDFNTDELTDEELEELGGLEYRALRFLSYLVAFYFVGTQLISFTLIAPWLSTTHEYDDVFSAQPRLVNKSWFVAFQIVGSYTGGGMSLVDQGMVPFQRAYLMIFSMIFAILAGNHGLVPSNTSNNRTDLTNDRWIMTKFVEDDSTMDKTLHFLLDHPRRQLTVLTLSSRCFLYLFPSHVTWYLLATLCTFTSIEWILYIVLDLGLDVLNALPPGVRAVTGLFQSFAVRASGFPIVSISSLAPSFQFLCVILMYIAVYPVALSIRSTNVYEEQSLGVFAAEPEDEDEEPALRESQGTRRERIGKYFGWHLRRQVAYDIWWLVCGIFFVCVIERTMIMDDNNAPWFNLFRIVFELVSAFGGIGLTLGIPTENYAFSGAFRPLSKLVVIVIMLRGRHRGLPVAIDRAILLPEDMVPVNPMSPQLPTTAPPSEIHYSLDKSEKTSMASPKTLSPQLERRIYSKEGQQPNMMDLVVQDMSSPGLLNVRNVQNGSHV
ncbi:TrkH-domain-containing protein [Cristinia sonorae]|uniref:TrkH-domain-containing protein n=1 Tax=Cristinia sonorae TaxID=1940300 RepID=A0A8K0XR36_9AGAR|nr:TrkH-domain-containing protein [Cristinia sonorae]